MIGRQFGRYRLVATNANGTTYGSDMTVTVPKK
jgi:hypothetical protein